MACRFQTFKTAPQPTRNFCSPFPRIGYASKTACRLRGNFQSLWLSSYNPFLIGISHRIYLGSWYWEIQILFQRSLSYKSYVTGMAFKAHKNLCWMTKFVHLIPCQNDFEWPPINWTNYVGRHKFLMRIERQSQSNNVCTEVRHGIKFWFPSICSLDIYQKNHPIKLFAPNLTSTTWALTGVKEFFSFNPKIVKSQIIVTIKLTLWFHSGGRQTVVLKTKEQFYYCTHYVVRVLFLFHNGASSLSE